MQQKKQLGSYGEQCAAAYLERQGYQIIESNFSIHDVGEIDLIVLQGDHLVCVEVKTRINPLVPFEYLVPRVKQKRIILTARHYMQRRKITTLVVRFDVVFVEMQSGKPVVTHIINAFTG